MRRESADYELWNKTKKKRIVAYIDVAKHPFKRLKGLLGKRNYENRALLIDRCQQVHTWFMQFPIDVLFLDENGIVIAKQRLKPWSVSKKMKRAVAVLEAEVDVFSDDRVTVGDELIIKKVVSK